MKSTTFLRNRTLATACLACSCFASASAEAATQTPNVSAETLILDGKAMPLGAGQASDPSLYNVNRQWVTLFTTIGWRSGCAAANSYDYVVRQTAATLTVGATLGATPASWQVLPDGQGGYAQWVLPGPAGTWDQDAIETPKIVSGYDPAQGKNVTRIYYTGWRRVATGTDSLGCPVYGYRDWKIGMSEWDVASNSWVKRSAPVVEGLNSWEQIHYQNSDGTLATYSIVGDQTVIYVPGQPGKWHMYYQATTDSPTLRVVTVHAASTDGVNWPASDRAILQTKPPSPSVTLPGGPYSLDVTFINGRYYFVGWLANADVNKQGLWLTSSSTPDGSATGDFAKWVPLIYDANGTWWHTADSQSLAEHVAGLVAPTLVNENGVYWLYYSGIRRDADGLWTSFGRVQVKQSALQ